MASRRRNKTGRKQQNTTLIHKSFEVTLLPTPCSELSRCRQLLIVLYWHFSVELYKLISPLNLKSWPTEITVHVTSKQQQFYKQVEINIVKIWIAKGKWNTRQITKERDLEKTYKEGNKHVLGKTVDSRERN